MLVFVEKSEPAAEMCMGVPPPALGISGTNLVFLWLDSCGFIIASDDREGLIVLGCASSPNLVVHIQSLL